ncbi:MAG: hypothetical protein ABIH23_33425 [bacterium]
MKKPEDIGSENHTAWSRISSTGYLYTISPVGRCQRGAGRQLVAFFASFRLRRMNRLAFILAAGVLFEFIFILHAAADSDPDILITQGNKRISCTILRMAGGKFIVTIGGTETSFPVSEVIQFQVKSREWLPEALIGSATTTFDLPFGNRPITLVAAAPLVIEDASSYPERSTFYSEPGRYLTGHLKHSIPYTLQQVRISFSFWTAENNFLGEQEYGHFDVKPGESIPFAVDLVQPRGKGIVEIILARITAFQSRTFKQRNYLPD